MLFQWLIMRKLFFASPSKQTVTMPQNNPKNKLLNRAFAIIFVILSLVFFCYMGYGIGSPLTVPLGPIAELSPLLITLFFFITPFGIGFTIILFGLFKEIWKSSLDFTFNRNCKWIFASIILFMVVVLSNAYWWIAYGSGWLSQYGWGAAFIEFFVGNFAQDTTILSLMLGILFLTNSNPQKSPSYKIILIGIVIWLIMFFFSYLLMAGTSIVGIQTPIAERYKDFLGYTIFQPWYWTDITYGIVTFIGAVWLLRTNTNIKKLILITIISFIVFFLLVTPFFPKPQFS